MSVVIETTIGDITVDLYTDERPIACLNFIKLCQLKYYNFNLFHTIEQGFIAQTGDPTGIGEEGSSIWGLLEGKDKRFFEAENVPKIYHSSAGLLSLVSAGKNLVGSQFFFTLGDHLTSLDGIHCVIGEVVEGHEILRKLNEAIVDEQLRPYQDIRITHTVVLDDPFPNPNGLHFPERSPSPSAERLRNGRIAADEDIDDTDGKTIEEIQEMLAEREAKARATILEIVGDIPDADVAPPENVLFVCKLNPVTTDDDLEIIFCRFGKIKGCEVIRDKKTGDSLQYAFVEFEDQQSCEAAYFKMDNVLIDDRRIHVDFSQSVAKVKWRGKGRGIEGDVGRLDFNDLKGDKRKRNHGRNENFSRNDSEHMSIDERRKAREQRHREQDRDRYSRRRSRSPPRKQSYNERQHNATDRYQRRSSPQRNERKKNYRNERRDFARSRSRDRSRRQSAERYQQWRSSPQTRVYRGSPHDERNSRNEGHHKRVLSKSEIQKVKIHKSDKKRKSKKSRRQSTSDDTTSSSSSSDSDSSSSSEISSNSSSSEERKRKKSSKKSKKTKKNSSHKKKSKKHKK